MRRSGLIWVASFVAFLLTVILVVTSGPAQEPLSHIKEAVGLPQVKSDGSALSPVGLSHGNTDFIWETPANSLASGKNLPASAIAPTMSNATTKWGGSKSASPAKTNTTQVNLTKANPAYQPREEVYLADPSNYGERYSRDASGNPVNNRYIVVLHETVGSALSALNLFQTHHPRDEDQVSYHSLIAADGTVIYVVPPEQRAFGAGNSAFRTATGEEAVFTNPAFPSSVNNFAYHVSLETPPDGRNNNATTHSGYTDAQYQSLAWLLARTTVPDERITTHRDVDRSGSRIDPRSFEPQRLFRYLHQYPSRQALNQS